MTGAAAGRRILAVSSSGGHWSQLMLLREAFAGHDVRWACTLAGVGAAAGIGPVEIVPECNADRLHRLPALVLRAIVVLWRHRPAVIVSTGALPGLVFISLGRLSGRRTIWVESIANSEALSLSGRWASRIAHDCFVQWPGLEGTGRARFAGSVL